MDLDKAVTIKGWMSHTELEFLANNAKLASTIVEFGCYLGRSTRALADNTDGIVYAVDPWDGVYYKDDGKPTPLFHKDNYIEFIHNLKDHITTGKVLVYKDYSYFFPLLIHADFVFIDGDHRYQQVYDDIMRGIYLLRYSPLELIAGHDYGHKDWPGVKDAVDEVFGPHVKVVDTIWYVKLKELGSPDETRNLHSHS